MDPLNPYPTGKSPPPSAPSLYDQPPVTGIPVAQHNYNYVDNYSQPPPPPPPPRPQPPSPPPPPRQPSHVVSRGKWSTGLCGCCSDISNCCITCWCPCITFGQIAEIVDQGSTSCGASGTIYTLICLLSGCGCLYSCFYRSKLRRQYMLPEKPCADCCVHFCCGCCALCQEHRELKRRGFDMSIGWQGNLERQNPGITMAPNFQGGMSR